MNYVKMVVVVMAAVAVSAVSLGAAGAAQRELRVVEAREGLPIPVGDAVATGVVDLASAPDRACWNTTTGEVCQEQAELGALTFAPPVTHIHVVASGGGSMTCYYAHAPLYGTTITSGVGVFDLTSTAPFVACVIDGGEPLTVSVE